MQADINDRVYMRVIDDAEAGPKIFAIPPATYMLEKFEATLQTALRVDYPDWTVGDTITTQGFRVITPSLREITHPAWYYAQWRGAVYDPLDSRSLNGILQWHVGGWCLDRYDIVAEAWGPRQHLRSDATWTVRRARLYC